MFYVSRVERAPDEGTHWYLLHQSVRRRLVQAVLELSNHCGDDTACAAPTIPVLVAVYCLILDDARAAASAGTSARCPSRRQRCCSRARVRGRIHLLRSYTARLPQTVFEEGMGTPDTNTYILDTDRAGYLLRYTSSPVSTYFYTISLRAQEIKRRSTKGDNICH
jgi:hypothetical protein